MSTRTWIIRGRLTKAPWARERSGSGIPPPGAVATVNLNDKKDGKISLPSGPAPGLGTSVEPGSIATAGLLPSPACIPPPRTKEAASRYLALAQRLAVNEKKRDNIAC